MEKKIKKLLIVFFTLMLLFTILSRAVASITTAKVRAVTVNNGRLTYKVSGTGIIKENAVKYVELTNGYKIGEVNIKEGQMVEEGELLFTYDLEQLMMCKSDLADEIKKIEFQNEKIDLSAQTVNGTVDYETALLTQENAKRTLKEAEDNLNDIKEKVSETKKEEYEKAAADWEDLNTSMEKAEKAAKREVSDSENELAELVPEQKIKDAIFNYKDAVISNNTQLISERQDELFDCFYKGNYKEHLQQVKDAKKLLERTKEDLADISSKWDRDLNYWDQFSDNEMIRNAYFDRATLKQEELKNANRAVADAEENVNKLTEKDISFQDEINKYYNYVDANDTVSQAVIYDVLYKMIYENLDIDKEQIAKAKEKLNRANEDLEEVQEEWSNKLDKATEEKEELFSDLKAIDNGTYDFEKDIKEGKKAIEDAKAALEAASLQVSNAEENQALAALNQEKNDQSAEIDHNIAQMDLEKKQEELEKVQTLIANDGKVTAPLAGAILEVDIEQGAVLSGQEKLTIATSGYELVMTADKEEMKYFAAGDEIKLKSTISNNEIISQIENIEIPDAEDNVSFSAILPEGDYRVGGSLDFELAKESEDFQLCVPIQALRQDTSTFILLVKENNSILGKEKTAFRLNVTVISQDSTTAAINASISSEDYVIIGSNKNISEGERVRLDEME